MGLNRVSLNGVYRCGRVGFASNYMRSGYRRTNSRSEESGAIGFL